MLSTKKAQGMSLNTIIIAIIVLIVLVVLVMIFMGYMGNIFTPTVGACATQGGKCAITCDTETVGPEIQNAKGCPGQKCCAGVAGIAEVGTPTAAAAPAAASGAPRPLPQAPAAPVIKPEPEQKIG